MEESLLKSQFQTVEKITAEMEKVIVGKGEVLKMLMIALLAGGHVLIEDVPGVGKTTLAMALGKATGLKFRRAQFTPDVMASDITGFTLYNKEANRFEYREGMVLTNIFLADEINRTSPKTQSALLECMEERTVTVDGTVHPLPSPFIVIATQNEVGYVGTYPLPEAQLDRFLLKVSMGYPTIEQEVSILADRQLADPIGSVVPVCDSAKIEEITETVHRIHIDRSVYQYIVELVSSTRRNKSILLGASPRASLALMKASQGFAFLGGRDYVIPEDVAAMLPYVICHRLELTADAKLRHVQPEEILEEIKKGVKAPFRK